MSVLDKIFGKPQQPVQQQQQMPQQQQSNPHVANNQTVPGTAANPAQTTAGNPGEQTQSPNDKFAKLWDTAPKQGEAAPNFKINPEQLKQVTSGMDFSRSINREDLAKVAQGGEEAVAALSSILNNFGKELFNTNAQFTSHMTESGYNTAAQLINRDLPSAVTKQMSAQELYTQNPKLRDPALQPLVSALQHQFSSQHPNATAQEINSLVTEYLGGTVAGAFAKPEPAPKQGGNNAQSDFSGFLMD